MYFKNTTFRERKREREKKVFDLKKAVKFRNIRICVVV